MITKIWKFKIETLIKNNPWIFNICIFSHEWRQLIKKPVLNFKSEYQITLYLFVFFRNVIKILNFRLIHLKYSDFNFRFSIFFSVTYRKTNLLLNLQALNPRNKNLINPSLKKQNLKFKKFHLYNIEKFKKSKIILKSISYLVITSVSIQ